MIAGSPQHLLSMLCELFLHAFRVLKTNEQCIAWQPYTYKLLLKHNKIHKYLINSFSWWAEFWWFLRKFAFWWRACSMAGVHHRSGNTFCLIEHLYIFFLLQIHKNTSCPIILFRNLLTTNHYSKSSNWSLRWSTNNCIHWMTIKTLVDFTHDCNSSNPMYESFPKFKTS